MYATGSGFPLIETSVAPETVPTVSAEQGASTSLPPPVSLRMSEETPMLTVPPADRSISASSALIFPKIVPFVAMILETPFTVDIP